MIQLYGEVGYPIPHSGQKKGFSIPHLDIRSIKIYLFYINIFFLNRSLQKADGWKRSWTTWRRTWARARAPPTRCSFKRPARAGTRRRSWRRTPCWRTSTSWRRPARSWWTRRTRKAPPKTCPISSVVYFPFSELGVWRIFATPKRLLSPNCLFSITWVTFFLHTLKRKGPHAFFCAAIFISGALAITFRA